MKCINKHCESSSLQVTNGFLMKLAGGYRQMTQYRCKKCGTPQSHASGEYITKEAWFEKVKKSINKQGMEEQSIIYIGLGPQIVVGAALNRLRNWELAIYLPFILISIEFKKKTENNKWFSFGNSFKQFIKPKKNEITH